MNKNEYTDYPKLLLAAQTVKFDPAFSKYLYTFYESSNVQR